MISERDLGLPPWSNKEFRETYHRINHAYVDHHPVEIETIPAMPFKQVTKEDAYSVHINHEYGAIEARFHIPAYRVTELIDVHSLGTISASEVIALKNEITALTDTVSLLLSVVEEHPDLSAMLKCEKVVRKLTE